MVKTITMYATSKRSLVKGLKASMVNYKMVVPLARAVGNKSGFYKVIFKK